MDLIPNLSLSVIAYPSMHLFRSGHVITQIPQNQRNTFFAERKRIADRGLFCRIHLKKTFLLPDGLFTALDPQVRLLTKFWC
jgi:hypothetical protein